MKMVMAPRDKEISTAELILFTLTETFQYNQCERLLPHGSPEETSEVPTGHSIFPATAGRALGSGFP